MSFKIRKGEIVVDYARFSMDVNCCENSYYYHCCYNSDFDCGIHGFFSPQKNAVLIMAYNITKTIPIVLSCKGAE